MLFNIKKFKKFNLSMINLKTLIKNKFIMINKSLIF